MTRFLMISAALLGALWLCWSMLGGASPANAAPATYHIDYAGGRDSNDGRARTSAWKHAPGDPEATGNPADMRLGPGDRLIFAGGVRYRGSIVLDAKGSAEAPIVLSGETGGKPAIIDGSDPVANVRRCASASECGGVAGWQRMMLIGFAEPLAENAVLFSDAGPLHLSQGPNPSDFFYRDEIADFIEADGARLERGEAELPAELARAIGGPGERMIAIWVKPNRVAYRPITALEGAVARFDPTGLKMYTDRPSWIAVAAHPALVDAPGEYAMLPGRRAAIALLLEGAQSVSVAQGRGGIDLAGSEYIAIRDLGFENMADDGKDYRTGVAIMAMRKPARGIRIENNRFRNFVMPRGQGTITFKNVGDVVVTGNLIESVSLGSGMRLSVGANYRIENNEIRRIGRTGIMLMIVDGALVTGNRISDVRGVHGNGVSAYLGNRNIRFLANTIIGSKQPATFHGNGSKQPPAEGILFANNLMIATDDALGALISWGSDTRGVVIRNNVLLGGGKGALRLSPKDSGVVVADNVIAGLLVTGEQPANWRMSGNVYTELSFQQRKGDDASSSSLLRATEALGRDGAPPAEICAVIGQSTLPLSAEERPFAGAIGAEIRCS